MRYSLFVLPIVLLCYGCDQNKSTNQPNPATSPEATSAESATDLPASVRALPEFQNYSVLLDLMLSTAYTEPNIFCAAEPITPPIFLLPDGSDIPKNAGGSTKLSDVAPSVLQLDPDTMLSIGRAAFYGMRSAGAASQDLTASFYGRPENCVRLDPSKLSNDVSAKYTQADGRANRIALVVGKIIFDHVESVSSFQRDLRPGEPARFERFNIFERLEGTRFLNHGGNVMLTRTVTIYLDPEDNRWHVLGDDSTPLKL